MKYEILYEDVKNKTKNSTVMEAENLIELYKLLEKSDIKHIIEIKEVKNV